jgi:hypothetical protein
MTQAAILIQSKFRSYQEQKKFQQSRRAAVLIQQYYRGYKEFGRLRLHRQGATAALVQHKLRYAYTVTCSDAYTQHTPRKLNTHINTHTFTHKVATTLTDTQQHK